MKKLFIAFLLLPCYLIAQNNGDSIKFEIIKASINFLATDKATFPNSTGISSKCISYDCLLKYCEDNKIKGANNKIAKWEKELIKSKDDITVFKDNIIAELTTGDISRTKRTKLSGYKKYIETLSTLVSTYKSIEIKTPNKDSLLKDTISISDSVFPVVISTEPPEQYKLNQLLLILALLLSCIAIIFCGYLILFFKRLQKINTDESPEFINRERDFKEFCNRIAQKATIDIKPIDKRIQDLESKIRNFEQQTKSIELEVQNNTSGERNILTNSVITQHFFAKLPDLGNGFSSKIILTNQNGEQIYELDIQDNTGSFTISSELNAQKYALSDFNYYLSSACDFINQPMRNCKIITIQKGVIFKSDGNWLIQNKAKIEFK